MVVINDISEDLLRDCVSKRLSRLKRQGARTEVE